MIFNSYQFMFFFPVFLVLYYIIPKKIRLIYLLLASYCFYMANTWQHAIILIFTTVVSYVAGMILCRIDNRKVKKTILWGAVIILAGVLGTYKFSQAALPMGLSFFTFQALGYVIDVYRNAENKESDFLCYSLFVSFFPTVVSGPIERGRTLIPQLRKCLIKQYSLNDIKENFYYGITYFVQGFFLKMVIADKAKVLVDQVFANFQLYGFVELLIGAILFSLQLYCDFYGYSLIAMGAAKFIGINLTENFQTPYFSRSITEFWRRWHISLSTWFRDYIYIPLGGSRCSALRCNVNKIITMLISGLWHGTGWNYIVWGGMHGCLMAYESSIRAAHSKQERTRLKEIIGRIGTLCAIVLLWIFFRADSLSHALKYIFRMFTHWQMNENGLMGLGLESMQLLILVVSLLILLFVSIMQYRNNMTLGDYLAMRPGWFGVFFLFLLLYFTLFFGEYGSGIQKAQFIYFQF